MKTLKLIAAFAFLSGCALAAAEEKTMTSPLSLKVKSIDKEEMDLSKFKGKVVLIVNVASQCGFTPQYKGLQELYNQYKDKGLVILGVPSNDFGMQEPGSEKEIKEFCSTNYKVTFPMTSKAVVKGDDKTELYKILTAATPDKSGKVTEVSWNFEKFLIGRDGKVVGRFNPRVKPDSEELVKAIKTELDKPAK